MASGERRETWPVHLAICARFCRGWACPSNSCFCSGRPPRRAGRWSEKVGEIRGKTENVGATLDCTRGKPTFSTGDRYRRGRRKEFWLDIPPTPLFCVCRGRKELTGGVFVCRGNTGDRSSGEWRVTLLRWSCGGQASAGWRVPKAERMRIGVTAQGDVPPVFRARVRNLREG